MRILIVKPSSLGDVIHAFPAVRLLEKSFPHLHIDWLIHPSFAELLDYLPCVDHKILFHRKELGKWSTFFKTFTELAKYLREQRYDMVIDLQGLLRSAFFARLAHAHHYYGPACAKEWSARLFYSDLMKYPPELSHAVEKNMAMIRCVKGVRNLPDEEEFRLPAVKKYSDAAQELLAAAGITGKRYIAVAPGARWHTKRWPTAFFAEVIRLVRKKTDIHFVLLGSRAEKKVSERIVCLTGSSGITNLTGKTTSGSMVELIRGAEVLICNDSGPMHAGAACGVPVVALFGPTDPELTGPWCSRKKVFVPELECVRCFRKRCPGMQCHEMIPAREVVEGVLSFLQEEGRGK